MIMDHDSAKQAYIQGALLEYMNDPIFKGLPLQWTPVTFYHEFKKGFIYREAKKDSNENYSKQKPPSLEDLQKLHMAQSYREGSHVAPQKSYKARFDLFPAAIALAAGRVLAFGRSKHTDDLWKRLTPAEHRAAALRHIFAHLESGAPDAESLESHLVHAICRLAFAAELERLGDV